MRPGGSDKHDDGRHQTSKIKLAVFDLDGTLTRTQTSVLRHVGQRFGFANEANRLSTLYSDGILRNADVSRIAAAQLRGRARVDLQRALETLPMVEGIRATVEMLARRRVHCVLATITFDFAANYVATQFGFRDVMATALEWSNGRVTGRVKRAREPEDKCRFIRDQCSKLEINESQVLVVGDTFTDLPAMKIAGFSIGFNPTPEVERVASVSLHETSDLRDVMPLILHRLADSL